MNDDSHNPLGKCVTQSLHRYFKDLNGERPTGIYQMVVSEVEKPLLEIVMKQAGGNQTRAAEMLSITRTTLRKKLRSYSLEK